MPNRFAQMVEQAFMKAHRHEYTYHDAAVICLRRQHAAMVRRVKRFRGVKPYTGMGEFISRDDLLAALADYKKGKS